MRYCMIFLLFFSSIFLSAQTYKNGDPLLPLNPARSVIFGKDIVIHDQPNRDQRKIAVCSAFNGWLYAVYGFDSTIYPWLTILKSTDNGLNWVNILEGALACDYGSLQSLDLMVVGNNETNLKLYFSYVASSISLGYSIGQIFRYNAMTTEYEKTLLYENATRGVFLATNLLYPAASANPYCLGILYSQSKNSSTEHLYYTSSADGGETLAFNDTLCASDKHFLNLGLTYGRSPSWSSGRYFAVWEQADNVNSPTGHIYTAHTEPNFNSPFTRPVCIDSLDPSAINLCRNPVIACQYSDTDNDSANLTTVILYEQYDPVNDRFDVKGVYNLQSTLSSCFKPLSFTNPAHENLQPDIAFNPYTSTFMATWYDATDQKLPFVTNSMNMQQPGNWTVVSTGFNDASNLEDPHPKVRLSFSEQKGINVWSSEGTGGNGVALFDAEYSPYTSVSEINRGEGAILSGAYPNPCDQYLNIAFELKKSEKVTIRLYDLSGQDLKLLCDQTYPSGKNLFRTLTADLSPGTYLYTFRAGEFSGYGKFSVLNH